ncbi:M56 family metallopeptidase [Actinomycetes bacterium M1A6_2h]
MIALSVVAAIPWLLCLLGARVAHRVDGWLVPATAVIVMPAVALVLAVCAAASALAVGTVLLTTASSWLWVLGGSLLGLVAWRIVEVLRHLARVGSSARAAAEFGRRADPSTRLLIIDDDTPDAFAVASGGGAVVMTTGLVAQLSRDELDALVLHERAHLRYRHQVSVQMTEVATRLVPLLRAASTVVRHAAERHADECAAHGDRRLAMTALARAALVCSRSHGESGSAALAGTGGDVVRRVRALSDPAPAPQRRIVVAVAVVLVVFVGALTYGLVDVVQDVVSPESGEVSTDMFR